MSITLHNAVEELRALLDQVDPETGELPDGLGDARAIVHNKALSVVAYILQSDRGIDMAEQYAKELAERIKSEKRRVVWLKTYLTEHMKAAAITKITDERGVFSAALSIGRDVSVEIYDPAQLPAEFMREIPVKYEPDKIKIRSVMDDGENVPGARLVRRDRLTIK